MSQVQAFMGSLVGVYVQLSNTASADIHAAPSTASYAVNNDGTVDRGINGTPTYFEDWITPTSAAGAAYEIMVTYTGDVPSGSATSTWLALDTSRSWSITTSSTPVSSTLTVQIRDAVTTTVLASATVTLDAEVI